ncbi:exonuclease 1-like [Plasmopara halstedii]|uniref:Exonuclease 1-like n=1 Tax=Plasmopara halstedii TaxID=4781 RepID=A0A0P1A9X7_PLAHL|nr:exonuclease 1-like [Plasmopara halstedii]CEG37543.1 exonuclease 1-like [Plasmopara halstedii]|eukprot:XP_024573912.1 exonuclease 1-like [Plasmopara halstedii]
MGIPGLLPMLKSITETKTIDEYKGQTLAIDGYCWLHRAIYSCSEEICLGHKTDKYVTYFMDRITTLLHHGVVPYVVFDGGYLPMKKDTEEERRKSRQKSRDLGIQHYKNKRFAEARKCFIRAAGVSPFMAHEVIQHLKAKKVAYIVAPYEADAQLAYLVMKGLANGVISEDSDCLPFGCQTVLFKMDRDNVAQEIKMINLKKNRGMSFHMFTDQMFLEMCIFSGCDYLPSIPGFGLKKAYSAIKQHGSFKKIIRALRLEGKVRIPVTYADDFEKAVLTFKHQRVFCPIKKKVVFLTPIPADLLEADPLMNFLGPMLTSDVAGAIADGDLDPITMMPFPAPILQPRRSILQPRSTNPIRLPIGARPNGAIKSFIQTSSAADNDPLRPVLNKRKFPSFCDKWMSKNETIKKTTLQSTASDTVAGPDADSPLSECHSLGASSTLSPPDEYIKSVPRNSNSSILQSLQPWKVGIRRDILIGSCKEKRRVLLEELKENQSPNRQVAPPNSSTLPVKETAFSRMMRAGPMLQQYKTKVRKTTGLATRNKRLQHASTSSRIEQFVFTSYKSKAPDLRTESMTDSKCTSQSTDDSTQSPADSKTNFSVDIKPTVCTLKEFQLDIDATNVQISKDAAASFDRFRFEK